ncbi:MAG: Hsp20/alpha crystallin family protein [Anaerovoracaceae bacterium]|jgi:HSP20 family protein|nr:Hsp20/alpha crystallin family protein [Anaerovoracaceae bacterium]
MNELKKYERNLFNVPSLFGENFFPTSNSIFRDFFGGNLDTGKYSLIKTDVTEDKDKYALEAELPGFSKDDIKIDLDGDYLTIKAERSFDEESEEKGKMIRRERYYGSYMRSFDVSGVDTEKINAEYKDGVLKVDLPKKPIEESKLAREIEVK